MERQTTFINAETADRKWYIVDATDQVLGRLATQIAFRLQGKHKPSYTPHCDTGDFIVVTNAEKVVLTGKKAEEKKEKRFSGYPGGLREVSYGELLETHPERVLMLAVKRMLPKSRLGDKMLTKLKIYAGENHPHAAQQPEVLTIGK